MLGVGLKKGEWEAFFILIQKIPNAEYNKKLISTSHQR
jgi:hypothetical protein